MSYRYGIDGDRIEDDDQQPHPADCPGLLGDPDRPHPCPVCRKPSRDRIMRQRVKDYLGSRSA